MLRASAILLLSLSACAGGQAGASSTPSTPRPLPAISLPQLGGGTWTASAARDRVLVIDVWASWCKPCRKGFPRLSELAQAKPEVAFVAVSIDEDIAAVRAFLAEVKVTMPVALDREQSLTEPPLEIRRVPTILIVDREGVLRHRLEEPSEADYRRLGALIDAL